MPSSQELSFVIRDHADIAKLGPRLDKVMNRVMEQPLQRVRADSVGIKLAADGDMVFRAATGATQAHISLCQDRTSVPGYRHPD